jgi:spermidine synthase
VEVVETPDFGRTLFLDSRFQTSEKDEFFYHEPLIHPAMVSHAAPRSVLVVGGGDGGSVEELAKYRCLERICMVELEPEVVEIAKSHLRPICGEAYDDPRLELSFGDGRKFLEETRDSFDVIVLDLTDPLPPSKYLYTKEFYQLCDSKLNPGGILSLHTETPYFEPEAFNVVTKTLEAVFSYRMQFLTFVPGYGLDFTFCICSSRPLSSPTPAEVEGRLQERGVGELQLYSPEMHHRLAALPGYVRRILATPCEISTDEKPFQMEDFK